MSHSARNIIPLHRGFAPAPEGMLRTFRAVVTLAGGGVVHRTIEATDTFSAIDDVLEHLDEVPADIKVRCISSTAFANAVTVPSDAMPLDALPCDDDTPTLPAAGSALAELHATLAQRREHCQATQQQGEDTSGAAFDAYAADHLPTALPHLRPRDRLLLAVAFCLSIVAFLLWAGVI